MITSTHAYPIRITDGIEVKSLLNKSCSLISLLGPGTEIVSHDEAFLYTS